MLRDDHDFLQVIEMKKMNVLLACALASIPAASFAAEVPAANVELNEDAKVVCRKVAETGSLAKFTKVCRTRKEWKLLQQRSRQETEQMTLSAPGQSGN